MYGTYQNYLETLRKIEINYLHTNHHFRKTNTRNGLHLFIYSTSDFSKCDFYWPCLSNKHEEIYCWDLSSLTWKHKDKENLTWSKNSIFTKHNFQVWRMTKYEKKNSMDLASLKLATSGRGGYLFTLRIQIIKEIKTSYLTVLKDNWNLKKSKRCIIRSFYSK